MMRPAGQKKWMVRECDPDLISRMSAGGRVSSLMARLLANRGVADAGEADVFLAPVLAGMHDPFLMTGMDRGVARLVAAIDKGEKVCVHGDYDVDGISATALLVEFFRAIGLDSFWYIPRRLLDGYGLSPDGVEAASARGATLVVTVDCGISSVEEARLCREAGLDLIVTDHHLPGETLPDAVAVINPHQAGCRFPFKQLAGVGVAFNLLVALRSRLRERGFFKSRIEPDLRASLDLVALGTIADVVPLVDENRIFVSYGLKELSQSRRAGVVALKEVSGIRGEVGCGAVGFRLAPRLNACGRLDDASVGVELLLTGDREKAVALAKALDAGNAERQAIEKEILQDTLEMIRSNPRMHGRNSIVLASADWHPGVIGIVASRLVDIYHRPTILISLTKGSGRGSGRSIPAFHLLDALGACGDHLLQFGGHRQAAGLAIAEETLELFAERFDEVAKGVLSGETLVPELWLDGELRPDEVTLDLVNELSALKPHGSGNPEPLFMLKGARVLNSRELKESHLKMVVGLGDYRFEAMGFGQAGKAAAGDEIDLVFSLGVNRWKGRETLQLTVRDLRLAGGDSAEG